MGYIKTAIRRFGNSQGVIIPRSVLDEMGLSVDSPIEMTVDDSLLVIRKIASHPREGWAEDAASLSDEEDWPAFSP